MTTKSEDQALVQAWIPRATRDELERRARENERSVSGELRLAIREHLDDEERGVET